MNFLSGQLEPGPPAVFRAGDMRVPLDRYAFDERASKGAAGGHCVLGVRPESIAIGADGAARPFSCEVHIEIVEPMGADTLVWTKLGRHQLRVAASTRRAGSSPASGSRMGFDPARASLFDERNPASGCDGAHDPPSPSGGRDMNWSFQLYSARHFQPRQAASSSRSPSRLQPRSRASTASMTIPRRFAPSSTTTA